MKVDLKLDVCQLQCPLPILKAKKALHTMQSGQRLKVMTTDKHAIEDFQAFCRQTGNILLEQGQEDGVDFHMIQRR
jgi:tRNA 2-thiouridine synthesizing protein A